MSNISNKKKKYYIKTLGCPKNLVDSEEIASKFSSADYQLCENASKAHIIIVNTCGFILPAKEESINTILALAQFKQQGKCQILIVTGCLVQLYKEELKKLLPEVDYFFDVKNFRNIKTILSNKSKNNGYYRKLLTPPHFAYLKISDGCNNFCSYCKIPIIRGKHKSRPLKEIIDEAKYLAEKGIKEIILIAQDIGNYGMDIYNQSKLITLIKELNKINNLTWIRLMYLHPKHINKELLYQIKESKKVCKYLDVPIQHCNDRILSDMNRKMTKKQLMKKLLMIRSMLDNFSVRTSIIVGFPGETQQEFQELVDFIKYYKFEKLGCFKYSNEEGTKSYSFPEQIPEKIKEKRFKTIMQTQQSISKSYLQNFVGKKIKIIVDKKIDDLVFECRSEYDAPEIDGLVYLMKNKAVIGKIIEAKVIDSLEYDLVAK